MSRVDTRSKAALHRDAYPVGRVAAEFFLRSFEIIGQLHRNVMSSLILLTLWHEALAEPTAARPMSVRELSRRLDLPFETVRRHIRRLARNGSCLSGRNGITLAPTVQRSARASAMLRKIHRHAVRMLDDLGRIDVARYRPRRPPTVQSRQLEGEQAVVVVAAIGVLLAAMKVLRRFSDGDLVSGLVFTAIRTANVKHITDDARAANRGIIPDTDRLPVSMLAIADSICVPYETVRRHAKALVGQGKCVRVGRRGLIAPARVFRRMDVESAAVHALVLDFLAELKAAGVRV
ncbi:MAG: hypothetical protein U1E21_10215 [Reyranellaceae bacterium]